MQADTCDLQNPGSPSVTVVMVAERERLDWLVLSDAVLLLDGPDGVRHVADRRIDEIVPEIRVRMGGMTPGTPEHQANGSSWSVNSADSGTSQAAIGSLRRCRKLPSMP
jgi:hypothetical protein